MVETLSSELAERGVQTQVFAADDDRPPAPRIEIWVERWKAMDPDKRGVGYLFGIAGQLATAGEYSVVCKAFRRGDTAPAWIQRYQGSIIGIDEAASSSQGEAVGSRIGSRVLGDAAAAPQRTSGR